MSWGKVMCAGPFEVFRGRNWIGLFIDFMLRIDGVATVLAGFRRFSLSADNSSTLLIVNDWIEPVNGEVNDEIEYLTVFSVGVVRVARELDTGGRSSTKTRSSWPRRVNWNTCQLLSLNGDVEWPTDSVWK